MVLDATLISHKPNGFERIFDRKRGRSLNIEQNQMQSKPKDRDGVDPNEYEYSGNINIRSEMR